MSTSKPLVAFLMVAFLALRAHAEPQFSFQFDQPQYTVAPGQSVTVGVWLYERVPFDDRATWIPSLTSGLSSAMVGVGYTSPFQTGYATLAPVAGATDGTQWGYRINPAFNETLDNPMNVATAALSPGVPNPIAGFVAMTLNLEATAKGTLVSSASGPGEFDIYKIKLGEFLFTGGTVDTSLTVADDGVVGYNMTVDALARELDNTSNPWGGILPGPTVILSVVPEPSTWAALSGLLVTGAGFWYFRRRRTAHGTAAHSPHHHRSGA